MAQQANILSFDDVKRSRSSQRAASARPRSASSSRNRRAQDGARFAQAAQSDRARSASSREAQHSRRRPSSESENIERSRRSTNSGGVRARYTSPLQGDSFESDTRSRNDEPFRSASMGSGRANKMPSWLDLDDSFGANAERGARAASARSERTASASRSNRDYVQTRGAHSAVMSYDDFLEEEDERFEGEARSSERRVGAGKKKGVLARFSDQRRKAAKEKAGRQFTRQFGDDGAASESGPRAAVYKGQMGSSQRRATRMQAGSVAGQRNSRSSARASRAAEANAKTNARDHGMRLPSIALPHLSLPSLPNAANSAFGVLFKTKKRIAALSVAACLILATCFMYPAAQQYYVQLRHLDKVQAEYQAVVDRNQELTDTRDYLTSEEGVAQTAHEKYGWVNEGEHSVLVYGLPEDDVIAETNLYVKSGSVDAPVTWYSVILDPLFGVS